MSLSVSSRRASAALAVVALAALAGCQTNERHSISVGAIPDDYRTNHPITIAERDQVLDLPVGASDHGMTRNQRERLGGFLSNYDRSASPVLTVMAPSGGVNHVAAKAAAKDFADYAADLGVPPGRIAIASYQSVSAEDAPPVRVIYAAMRSGTAKCGRWPDDLMANSENRHYANFGCASQNNLAAQVANPNDLLGPRRQTTIDAENRNRSIGAYQEREISREFVRESEINY
ncbi:MAG: pilus assembly protein CpaD [Mesorhizobium amorphae]|nr:MAG: pilus assembly protein CpaD [Mesorhizobium amorphae]